MSGRRWMPWTLAVMLGLGSTVGTGGQAAAAERKKAKAGSKVAGAAKVEPKPSPTTHAGLINGEAGIVRLAVLPTDMQIDRSTVKGTETSADLSEAFEQVFNDELRAALQRFGFTLVDSSLKADDPELLRELKYELAQLESRFSRMQIRTVTDPVTGKQQVSDERIAADQLMFSLNAIPFATEWGADGLVFSQAYGIIHTTGKQATFLALGAASGVYYTFESMFFYEIGLIDGEGGEVRMCALGFVTPGAFEGQDTLPGQANFDANLQEFRDLLRTGLEKKLTTVLERKPGDPMPGVRSDSPNTEPAPAP